MAVCSGEAGGLARGRPRSVRAAAKPAWVCERGAVRRWGPTWVGGSAVGRIAPRSQGMGLCTPGAVILRISRVTGREAPLLLPLDAGGESRRPDGRVARAGSRGWPGLGSLVPLDPCAGALRGRVAGTRQPRARRRSGQTQYGRCHTHSRVTALLLKISENRMWCIFST